MAIDDKRNQEPKKEKNIKHGVIAVSAMVIAVLLIVIAAYFSGDHHAQNNKVKPVQVTEVTQ